jgi:RNA polymerase sigma factor (sigma-70 family)
VNVDEDRHDALMVQPEYVQRSIECREIVEQALATLTAAQRRVIELLHFEGRTLQEISQMEGKELSGIRNSYYRGVNALRITLGKGVRPAAIRPTGMEKRREEYEIEL